MIHVLRQVPKTTRVRSHGMSSAIRDDGRNSRNYMIAGGLLAFTGGIYYTAISKMMGEKDDLMELEKDAAGTK